jgi:hypothetical protein
MEVIMESRSPTSGSKTRERFVRIAAARVNKVLDVMDSLGKCSDRRNYAYTEDDIKKIFNEIERKLRETKALFQGTSKSKKRFHL